MNMNVYWWVSGTVLPALLVAAAWRPCRAALVRPRLFDDLAEVAPDDVQPYALSGVRWRSATPIMDIWDQTRTPRGVPRTSPPSPFAGRPMPGDGAHQAAGRLPAPAAPHGRRRADRRATHRRG